MCRWSCEWGRQHIRRSARQSTPGLSSMGFPGMWYGQVCMSTLLACSSPTSSTRWRAASETAKKLKGVVPGGSSTPILLPEEIDGARMSADALRKVGSMMGTAGMLVLDEDTDMVRFAYRIAAFYKHESCGQCTPCREGTGWLKGILGKFLHNEATFQDIDLLLDVGNQMEGRTICALADAAVWPVRAIVKKYRAEFERRAKPVLIPI